MEKGADGKIAITRVILKPRVEWKDEGPGPAALADLHHKSHQACFIANSVKSEVTIQQ
jgi:organic hydroperoxide reductase OsmC/OhrA